MSFEFIPHVQGRHVLSHMHKRCHTPPQMPIYWRDLEFILDTHFVETFSSLLDGDGAVFLVLPLGLLGAASWWSILDESPWGCVTHVGG